MFRAIGALVAVLLSLIPASGSVRADAPLRDAAALARAVETRAGAVTFEDLYAFGREAMARQDREGLNRLHHVVWTTLNQGDFERTQLWNDRLEAAARRLDDARYLEVARINALTRRYDGGDPSAAESIETIANTAGDWFVEAHATRVHAMILMHQDRIGEALERLADMNGRIPDDDPHADMARAGLWEMTGMGLAALNDVIGAAAAFTRYEIDYADPAYPRPDFDSLYNLAQLFARMGELDQADALQKAHHRLSVRSGLESLMAYDALLCGVIAEAREEPAQVLSCLQRYADDLGEAGFLAYDLLPLRAFAYARMGRPAAAERDLVMARRFMADDGVDEADFPRLALADAELLFAQGRPGAAYEVLRTYAMANETAQARRFSGGIHQVTGDMQAELEQRRRQLALAESNAELQQTMIRVQQWMVGVAGLLMIGVILAMIWQLRQSRDLRQARVNAEAASRAKSAFLANMSHEIRTPLNGVVAMADALSRADLKPREQEMAEVIRSSGETLERLLSDILDSAKIESGQITVERAPFHLGEAVRDVAALWRLRAQEKDVLLNARIDPALDRMVNGDGVRVRQILANLVSNALKFTDVGAITISVEPGDGRKVRFTVTDTGIGFDAEQKARIFGRFQQADGSITRRFGGTGLGLAISRDLARLMGGTLDCDSRPGEGSSFWFEIPLPPVEGADAVPVGAAPAVPSEQGDMAARPLKVLLADDHPANRKVVEVMLSGTAVALTTVEDGRAAVEAWAVEAWDLVLMDMQMPVMDGLSATRAIRLAESRDGRARTPILMLTANALEEHVKAGREAGADGHLAKPITLNGLFEAMSAVL